MQKKTSPVAHFAHFRFGIPCVFVAEVLRVMDEEGNATADILFDGGVSGVENDRDFDNGPRQPTRTAAKPKPRVQINDPSDRSQGKAARNEVSQGIRMRGNVLIQNPSLDWKVRTCELNGSFLTFFRKQKMVAAIDLEQVGDINILKQVKDGSGQGFIFSLHLKEGRYFNVRVTAYEDATNWVKVLADVRDKLRSHQSNRSRSFSAWQDSQPSFTPLTTDFNASLVADEADDNIKVYFDNEQYPPSPILQLNEKYIRPVQAKDGTATTASEVSPAAAGAAGEASLRRQSGIPVLAPTKRPQATSTAPPSAASDTEVSVNREGDTSPRRVSPDHDGGHRLSPEREAPGPLGYSSPGAQGGRMLFAAADEAPGAAATERGGPVPMTMPSAEESSGKTTAAATTPTSSSSPQNISVRERRLEEERVRKAAVERMAAEQVAEEDRQRAAKAARESKEAAERTAREQRLLAERQEREARLAAERAAEEERSAAERAKKEAWLASERAARERKLIEERALRASQVAEKAAEEVRQRKQRAAEEKEREERAARIAEREALGKKKLAEAAAAAREEAVRAEKQRVEEALRRKLQLGSPSRQSSAQAKAQPLSQPQSPAKPLPQALPPLAQSSPTQAHTQVRQVELAPECSSGSLIGSQTSMTAEPRKPPLPFTRSEDEFNASDPWRFSRSYDHGGAVCDTAANLLAGIEGVTLVESPRSSFSSNVSPSSRGTTNNEDRQSPAPLSSPDALRFPLRKVMTVPTDPKTSFYNADGSFRPAPKSSLAAPPTPDRTSVTGSPRSAAAKKQQQAPSAPNSADRAALRATQSAQYSALTTQNVAAHKSSSSGTPSPNTTSTPPSQQTLVSKPSTQATGSSTTRQDSTPAESESSLENLLPNSSSSLLRRTISTAGSALKSPPFPGDFTSPPNNPWSPGLCKNPATRPTPSSPSRRPVAKATTARSGGACSSVWIFFTIAVSAVLLVLLLLGSMHFYNRHMTEEQWRTASLQQLQTIKQNYRSAEDLSRPAAGVTTVLAHPTTGSADHSETASPATLAGRSQVTHASVAQTKGTPPAGSAVHGVRVTTVAPSDAYGTSVVRSNTIFRRFFRDLVRASTRFIVNIFSRVTRLFKPRKA